MSMLMWLNHRKNTYGSWCNKTTKKGAEKIMSWMVCMRNNNLMCHTCGGTSFMFIGFLIIHLRSPFHTGTWRWACYDPCDTPPFCVNIPEVSLGVKVVSPLSSESPTCLKVFSADWCEDALTFQQKRLCIGRYLLQQHWRFSVWKGIMSLATSGKIWCTHMEQSMFQYQTSCYTTAKQYIKWKEGQLQLL